MPNRQIINREPYRYGYQGDYAETDPETGKPAFELRIYDPRINRWLTVDPYGQYDSPYMSMGNSWLNRVDPDGGCDQPDSSCGWFKRLFYSSTQIGAWESWQAMGTAGSQEMLNNVTVTGTSRETLRSRATEMIEEQNFIQTMNETPGLEVRYHENRFVALGHNLGMASPTARFNGLLNLMSKNIPEGISVMKNLTKRFPGFKPLVTRIGGSANKSQIAPKLQEVAKGEWIKVYQGGHIKGKAIEIHYYYTRLQEKL